MERILAFPNALRMSLLLLRETGALPYDAVSADEKWDESKEHSKWMALSLFSLYRFVYRLPNVTVAFLPMREYPVRGQQTVFSSMLALNAGILDLIRIGASCTWYHASSAPSWNPFQLSDLSENIEWGFGGSAGILLDFGKVRLGMDYSTRPKNVFRGLDDRGFPVRDDSFSFGLLWQIKDDLDVSLDLPNWNNSGREDFLLPRGGVSWKYHRMEGAAASLQCGFFFDSRGDLYLSSGAGISGIWGSFRFKAGIAGVFGVDAGSENSLILSVDFFM